MASGMDTLMSRLGGLIPEDLKRSVEQFMSDMQRAAEKINANQVRIETALASLQASINRLEGMQDDHNAHIVSAIRLLMPTPPITTHILDENGQASGNFITSEKFPQEMLDDVMATERAQAENIKNLMGSAGIPTASDFEAATPGGDYGRRRSNSEE